MTKTGGQTIRRPRPRAIRMFIGALNIALVTLLLGAAPALADDASSVPAAQGNTQASTVACPVTPAGIITDVTYRLVNGPAVTNLYGDHIHPGDHVAVSFTIAPNCTDVLVSFVSYFVPPGGYDTKSLQTVFSESGHTFSSGPHTDALSIFIPCTWQADLVLGPVIAHLGQPNYYGTEHLRDSGTGTGPCVTESIEATSSATSEVHGANSSEPKAAVLAAAVTNPNTGRSVDVATGILALFMVLAGFALFAETRRRGLAPASGPTAPLEPAPATPSVEADLPAAKDDHHRPGAGSIVGMLTLLTILVAFGLVVGRRRS